MGAAPKEHARDGVPANWAEAVLPRHKVAIGYAFWLGKHEVTRGEFAAFVQATGHQMDHGAADDWCNPGFEQTDRDRHRGQLTAHGLR